MQMLNILLFITSIIFCKGFTKGFIKGLSPKLNRFSTRLNARLISTTFYEDDDGNDRRRKTYNYDYDYHYNYDYYSINDAFIPLINEDIINEDIINEDIINEDIINKDVNINNYETLYTLIWFDCDDCRKLLEDVKNARKKILYIDGSYYFFDENDETNTPIFYKDDELIATDVFSIYEELFYN